MTRMRIAVLFLPLLLTAGCGASSQITWHRYIHHPSGQVHYVLYCASYKRGLFFGSCGPATRSLQWECTIELSGEGPVYPKDSIKVTDGDLLPVEVDSGCIVVDRAKRTARIDLSVRDGATVRKYAHDGTYPMREEP